jgi:hypothetical protein
MFLSCVRSGQPQSRRKAAYFYAHRGDGDIYQLAVQDNVRRMRKQAADPCARGPLPILARDKQTYEALLAAREALHDSYKREYEVALTDRRALREKLEANRAAVEMERRRLIEGSAELDQKQRYEALLGTREALVGEYEREQELPRTDNHELAKTLEANLTNVKEEHRRLAQVTAEPAKLALLDAVEGNTRFASAVQDQQRVVVLRGERLRAVYATKILSPEQKPLRTLHPSRTKLYQLGHGAAGHPMLWSEEGGDASTVTEVAEGLKAAGLPRQFKWFYVYACSSADASVRRAFGAPEDAPAGEKSGHPPLAQTFADALFEAGFKKVRVRGYEGLWVVSPRGATAERSIAGDDFGLTAERVRSSTVAKVFVPRRKNKKSTT